MNQAYWIEKVRAVDECYDCMCVRKSTDYPGGFALEQAMRCSECLSLIISAIREEVIEEAVACVHSHLPQDDNPRLSDEVTDLLCNIEDAIDAMKEVKP